MRLLADGKFQLHADWNGQAGVIVESSQDLKSWVYEWLSPAGQGVIAFTDTTASGSQKFYRARDYVIPFAGMIRDIENEAPIAGATLRLSFSPGPEPERMTQSDDAGEFQLAVRPAGVGNFRMVIEKPGYVPLAVYGSYAPYTKQLPMRVDLAPPGYRPPNDDFINRAALVGTNITVDASTFAATSEPGHSLSIAYDDVVEDYPQNRWWTWTAPMDGAIGVFLDQSHVRAGVVVYRGTSLQDLVGVWDSSHGDDGFFVRKGVQYQIAFGTPAPGQAGFTLRTIPPVAPSIRQHPFPGSPMRGPVSATYEVGEPLLLSAEAEGTRSLQYQWRKDGVDIPNATGPFFGVAQVELKDGGAYSILVSNEAGAVVSDEVEITVLLQKPHLPEVMRGTWTQETSSERVIVTFSDTQFSLQLPSNGPVLTGTYRLTEALLQDHYRLVTTYTGVAPGDVEDYILSFVNPQQVPYVGNFIPSGGRPNFRSGTFTRTSLGP